MSLRIGVLGAGLVGGLLGTVASAAGAEVVFVARPGRVPDRRRLQVRLLAGHEVEPAPGVSITDDPATLGDVDVCLVCVKATATGQAAAVLREVLADETIVISFQNGMRNVPVLASALAGPVVPGVVTFNLRRREDGGIAQVTRGHLVCGRLPDDRILGLRKLLIRGGVDLRLRRHAERYVAGKLLMNLNNGVCAATGLTIPASLASGAARWCFAACIQEGIVHMRAAGVRPAAVTGLPPAMVARVMALPDRVVDPAVRLILRPRGGARSSTLQDLDAGRATEIDLLNGEIVALARSRNELAPANATVVDIVHGHEQAVARGMSPSFVEPRRLRELIQRRRELN